VTLPVYERLQSSVQAARYHKKSKNAAATAKLLAQPQARMDEINNSIKVSYPVASLYPIPFNPFSSRKMLLLLLQP
jgi:hypothetical protein